MAALEHFFSNPRNFFSASHFLVGFSRCDRLHGHNYQVGVRIKYHQLDFDSPIDYQTINKIIQKELQLLNHKIILPEQSNLIKISISDNGENWEVTVGKKWYSFPQKDVVILKGIGQTTSENIALYLHGRLSLWLKSNFPNMIKCLEIEISENIGNQAIYSAPVE